MVNSTKSAVNVLHNIKYIMNTILYVLHNIKYIMNTIPLVLGVMWISSGKESTQPREK